MKQVKCFFKIQIPVCRITMQARGFAVWTTPSPRGDWNSILVPPIVLYNIESELPPHREVIETFIAYWTAFRLLSELPPHREVIETRTGRASAWFQTSGLNHPLTARCLTPIPDILKRYRGFFYAKNLKNGLVRVYIVKGKAPEKISEKSFRKT